MLRGGGGASSGLMRVAAWFRNRALRTDLKNLTVQCDPDS